MEKYGVLIPSKFKLIDLLNLEKKIREEKNYSRRKIRSAVSPLILLILHTVQLVFQFLNHFIQKN